MPCNRLPVSVLVTAMYSLVICIVLINVSSQLYASPSSTLSRVSDSSPIKINWLSQDNILNTNKIRRRVPMKSYSHSSNDRSATIISQNDTYYRPDGSFAYSFETDNGISTNVTGYQKKFGDQQGQAMDGVYSYISPEGINFTTRWYADETGFHARVKSA